MMERENGAAEGDFLATFKNDVVNGQKIIVIRMCDYDEFQNRRLLRVMIDFRRICYSYKKTIGGYIGLQVKQLSAQQLDERFRLLYTKHLNLSSLKIGRNTFKLFHVKNRPMCAFDALSVYKESLYGAR